MPSIVFPDDLAPWISSLFEISKELRRQADNLSLLTSPVPIESIHEIDHHVGMSLQRAFEMGCFGRLHEWDLESLGRVIKQGDARSFSCHLRCQIFPVNDREYRDQFATVEAEHVAEYRRLADEVYAYGCRLNNWSEVRAELLNAERDVEPILRRNDLRERITKSQAETLRAHLATLWLKCEPQESQRELGKEYHPSCGYTRLEDGSHDPVLLDRRAVWDRVYNRKVKAALLGAAEVAGLGNISKELLDNSVLRDSHEWDRFLAAAERDDAAEQRARPAPTATELRSLADRLRKLAKAIFQSGKWDTPFVKVECATIPHPLVTGWFTRANARQDKEQKRLFETVCSLLGKIYSGGVIESPHERLESLASDVEELAATIEPWSETAATVGDSVSVTTKTPDGEQQPSLTWQVVLPKAESYVQRNGFPGLKALARQLACHPTVLRKAINHSEKLRAAEQRHKDSKKAGIPQRRRQRIYDALADSLGTKIAAADSIATDDVFQRLVDAARNEDEREVLLKKSPEERRELVAVLTDDPDKEFRIGKAGRASGRDHVTTSNPR